jgi:hypothetical protein
MTTSNKIDTLTRLMLVVMMGLVVGCGSLQTGVDGARTQSIKRAELLDVRAARKQLPGKTMADVLRAVGRPDRQAGNSEWEWWTYEEAFFDPITKRTLPVVTFVFRDGRLLDITF